MPVQTRVESIDKPGMEGGGGIYTYSAGCQAPRWIRELDLGENGSTQGGSSLLKEAFADMGCGFLRAGIGLPEGMAWHTDTRQQLSGVADANGPDPSLV
jgi:hypothetical protein